MGKNAMRLHLLLLFELLLLHALQPTVTSRDAALHSRRVVLRATAVSVAAAAAMSAAAAALLATAAAARPS